jgi:hypothetical protein
VLDDISPPAVAQNLPAGHEASVAAAVLLLLPPTVSTAIISCGATSSQNVTVTTELTHLSSLLSRRYMLTSH